jgi:hypothetical protein
MATTKRNSRILNEMHETARGLHGAGLISKRRMGEFPRFLKRYQLPPSVEQVRKELSLERKQITDKLADVRLRQELEREQLCQQVQKLTVKPD